MDIESFREYCLSLPGSSEKMPFEKSFRGKHSFLAFYVNGHMFCFFDIDRFDQCNLRCTSDRICLLMSLHSGICRGSSVYYSIQPMVNSCPEDVINDVCILTTELCSGNSIYMPQETILAYHNIFSGKKTKMIL